VNRRNFARLLVAWVCLAGCDQLGNPPQFATGPTAWSDQNGHIVTTTRSFRDERTIRRLLSGGVVELDYADPSIGPSQTLTLVSAVPRRLRLTRRPEVRLATVFSFRAGRPIVRRWSAPVSSRQWSAAFAMPEPPVDAVTSVVP
jgi:hypothetical protein